MMLHFVWLTAAIQQMLVPFLSPSHRKENTYHMPQEMVPPTCLGQCLALVVDLLSMIDRTIQRPCV